MLSCLIHQNSADYSNGGGGAHWKDCHNDECGFDSSRSFSRHSLLLMRIRMYFRFLLCLDLLRDFVTLT